MRKIAGLRRARCRTALPASREDSQLPIPDCPWSHGLGGPRGILVRLHPNSPEPWERRAAGRAHARLRLGPSPARRVWGKFGEVCLGRGRMSQRPSCPGDGTRRPRSPGSRLGGEPEATKGGRRWEREAFCVWHRRVACAQTQQRAPPPPQRLRRCIRLRGASLQPGLPPPPAPAFVRL